MDDGKQNGKKERMERRRVAGGGLRRIWKEGDYTTRKKICKKEL